MDLTARERGLAHASRIQREIPDPEHWRDDLAKDLTECHERIRGHATALREYESWLALLKSGDEDKHLQLTYSDWQFFMGAIQPDDAEA